MSHEYEFIIIIIIIVKLEWHLGKIDRNFKQIYLNTNNKKKDSIILATPQRQHVGPTSLKCFSDLLLLDG